jgi:hypothetical protein
VVSWEIVFLIEIIPNIPDVNENKSHLSRLSITFRKHEQLLIGHRYLQCVSCIHQGACCMEH